MKDGCLRCCNVLGIKVVEFVEQDLDVLISAGLIDPKPDVIQDAGGRYYLT
jgi:hypothetical protein